MPLPFRREKPVDAKLIEEISRAKEKKKEEQQKKKQPRKEAHSSDPKTNSLTLEKACPDRQRNENPDAKILLQRVEIALYERASISDEREANGPANWRRPRHVRYR